MKLVSVIIPTYKGSMQLGRAIKSVCEQTYRNIEVIVIDDNGDGTEDQRKTENVINALNISVPFQYIKHSKNRNGACARNTGISASKGEYICFLDDDDYFLPEKIEKCVDVLEKKRTFDGVYTSVGIKKNKGVEIISTAHEEGNLYKFLLLDECYFGTGSNIFITKRAISKIKGFDESFRRNQDVEFMLRFFRCFKILAIPDILVLKGTNGTYNIPSYKIMKECKKLLRKKFTDEIRSLGADLIKFDKNETESLYSTALFSKDGRLKMIQRKELEKYRELSFKEKLMFIIAMCNMYKLYVSIRNKIKLLKKGI